MSEGPEHWGVRRDQEPVAPSDLDEGPSSAATPSRPGPGIIRPMPTRADGPSFEALTMKSVLSRARDNSRFEAPEAPDDTTGTGRRLPIRALLVLAMGVLVLGVVGGAVWVGFFRDSPIDETTKVTPSETASVEVRTPQETVRGYLQALSEGDIEKALAFGPRGAEGSRVLLEPSAYDSMPPESRPTNITITTDDPLATEVHASYTLAGEAVTTTMRVTRDNESYRMERTTVPIHLQIVGADNLPVFVNGVEVDHNLPLEVVPGTYAPSTGLPFVEFPATSSTISIQSLAYSDAPEFLVNPELTPAGHSALLDAAKASLESCVASRELTPTGCPNAIRAPKPVVPGSVKWTLEKGGVWSSFNPTLSPSDQTVAVATVSLHLRVTMDYTDGSSSGNRDLKPNVAMTATMLGQDPSSVIVSWKG